MVQKPAASEHEPPRKAVKLDEAESRLAVVVVVVGPAAAVVVVAGCGAAGVVSANGQSWVLQEPGSRSRSPLEWLHAAPPL